MNFWEKLVNIDRRIIYAVIFLAVIIPMLIPIGLPVTVTSEVENLYNHIDKLDANSKPVLISADYDPSTSPELSPMLESILTHCFQKNVKVIVTTLMPAGTGVANLAIQKVVPNFPKIEKYKDYVFMGFAAGYHIAILQIGENLRNAFPASYEGVPYANIEMLQNVKNYNDISLVISISGTGIGLSWLDYANARYNANLALGVTGVMGPDYYPYLQSGQLVGMLGGLKGAAEYENLLDSPGVATQGMDVQSVVHILIIFFIVLGNIGFFASKQHKQGLRR